MKRAAVLTLVLVIAAGAAGFAVAAARQGAEGPEVRRNQKITICHATSSDRNPFVEESPDVDGILSGHADHPGDIIPPFEIEDPRPGEPTSFPGKNWDDEGRATLEKGCDVPPEAPKGPIGVFVTCVDNLADGSFSATFGYNSENEVAVEIAVGGGNRVEPDPEDRGQPTTFQPGLVPSAFTATGGVGATLVWSVTYNGTHTAGATADFGTKCSPPPEPPSAVVDVFVRCVNVTGTTYSATFGYRNPGSDSIHRAIGDANRFSPGDENRGQPILFVSGSDGDVFTVTGIPVATELAWTLVTGGQTRVATASASATPCPPSPPASTVHVFVECVDNQGTTYNARFRYESTASDPVTIVIGAENAFSPGQANRGQPSVFQPGSVDSAVTVTEVPNATDLTWTLRTGTSSSTATASAGHPSKCATPPVPEQLPIRIAVECVTTGATTFAARFRYQSENGEPVSIPIGGANGFAPGAVDRGQPSVFQPGLAAAAFTVDGVPNGTAATWSVTYAGETRTATATAGFATACSTSPPPNDPNPGAVGVFVQCVTTRGGTFDAVFGYQNDNEDVVTIEGDDNRFAPSPAVRGQPTKFAPGNTQEAFTVTGIATGTPLEWKVTHAGATRIATATAAFPTRCVGSEPEPTVQPIGIFACVSAVSGGRFDIVFGYENDNGVDIPIPVGIANFFAPSPLNRGQTTLFSPGRHENAFTVRSVADSAVLVWTLSLQGMRSLVVTAAYPVRCSRPATPQPIDPFPLCVLRTGSTYTAVFGYASGTHGDVTIPVGASNRMTPGPAGQGQPTIFRPGLVYAAFSVENVPVGRSLSWTVRHAGRSDTATIRASFRRRCELVRIDPDVDMTIAKRADRATVAVADRITYTLTVRNAGQNPAAEVTVVDRPLDDGVTLLSATASQGRCGVFGPRAEGGRRAACELGAIGSLTRSPSAMRARTRRRRSPWWTGRSTTA